MSRRPVNPARRFADGGSIPFVGSVQSKTRSSRLLSIGLLVVGAILLIGYLHSGSDGSIREKKALSKTEGGSSCTLEVLRALPVLKKAYGDSMNKVLHVAPDTCSVVSKLLKEEDTQAWGVEPYDLDDADVNCKSLVRKGIVRVADIKFPLPYRAKSFSLVIVSDALDYLSPRYLNKTLPELVRVSADGVIIFSGYPGQQRAKVAELSKFGRPTKLEENEAAAKKFEQASTKRKASISSSPTHPQVLQFKPIAAANNIDAYATGSDTDASDGYSCDYSDGSWIYDPDARFDSAGFVGDSLNRNMFVSLFCTLKRVSGGVKKWRAAGADRGFTFLQYNLTIAYHRTNLLARYGRWSANGNGGKLEALGYKEGYRVDVDIPEGTWEKAPSFHDILIFNTGHWWWAPSKFDPVKSPMLFFEKGLPVIPPVPPDVGLDKVLKHMIRFVEKNMQRGAIKLFRTQSPRHFEGGDWDQGGSCQRLQPLLPEQVEELFSLKNNGTNAEAGLVNQHLFKALKGSKFHILDITRMSEFRADAHPSSAGGKKHDDCMHWCLPGITDTWNDLFVTHLNSLKIGN
ncbi:PC-Esterase - like 1 [Theobroma cacao]|nr:PC-Esterase - like 1 [Theobroma cacao]